MKPIHSKNTARSGRLRSIDDKRHGNLNAFRALRWSASAVKGKPPTPGNFSPKTPIDHHPSDSWTDHRATSRTHESIFGICARIVMGATMVALGLLLILTFWLMPLGLLMAFVGTALIGPGRSTAETTSG